MTSYGVGILRDVKMGPPIVEYLERIDATLAPDDGHFIVHGGQAEVLEGSSPGTLVVIEFPDRSRAEGWYASTETIGPQTYPTKCDARLSIHTLDISLKPAIEIVGRLGSTQQ
jgi:uncharacterized protein (DUF1330 family)